MVFRVSKGKVISFFSDDYMTLTDEDGNQMDRQVYLLIFSQGGFLRERINRVCDSFNGKTFELPGEGQGSRDAFMQEQVDVDKRIKQM